MYFFCLEKLCYICPHMKSEKAIYYYVVAFLVGYLKLFGGL